MDNKIKAICFGEVLYDVFPDKEHIGGAPLNVASRLSSIGISTEMISKVGNDEKGVQILKYLQNKNVKAANIAKDQEHPTGVVNVSLSPGGSATYQIAYPSAWDKIELTHEIIQAVENSDLFIFGSLACRDKVSRQSLFKLLPRARYRVLDFNLRKPHYSEELLSKLLAEADFIKFNDDELYEIAEFLGSCYNSLEQNLRYVAERAAAKTICVTKGRHGAVLLRNGKLYYNSGFKIKVVDTVGAGDSFLAGLVAKLFQDDKPQNALDYACAIGALVAGEVGANPPLDPLKIRKFIYAPGF